MATNNETRIDELLHSVDDDPHAVAQLLALAGNYLKNRELMPDALADYLAHAFCWAASAPLSDDGKRIEDERIARLIDGLCLKRKEGRPRAKIPKGDVTLTVAVFGETVSETKLKADLAAAYRVGKSTARSRIKEAKAELADARDKTREIQGSNGLKSLVRRR